MLDCTIVFWHFSNFKSFIISSIFFCLLLTSPFIFKFAANFKVSIQKVQGSKIKTEIISILSDKKWNTDLYFIC